MTENTAHIAVSEALAYVRQARRLVPVDDAAGSGDFLRAELLDLEDLFAPLNLDDVTVPTPTGTAHALDRAARLLVQDAVRPHVPLLIWAALSDLRGRLTP